MAIDASAAIVDYAVQYRLDLIVLGTHGCGAISHLLPAASRSGWSERQPVPC